MPDQWIKGHSVFQVRLNRKNTQSFSFVLREIHFLASEIIAVHSPVFKDVILESGETLDEYGFGVTLKSGTYFEVFGDEIKKFVQEKGIENE